jgi:CelD/BcsL family acetyltransferase involved in cellulose biosynthesis
LKVTLVPAAELSRDLTDAWAGIVRGNPALASPFFTPEFTRAAAAACDAVEVAVVEDGAGPTAFFPFQRGRNDVGLPTACGMSDFHGVIALPDAEWDAASLVRAAGLVAWKFDHLLADQAPLRPFHWTVARSPYLDLSGGFEAWRQRHRASGSREIETLLYKRRVAERRAGPVRFELQTADDAPFQALLRWKSRHYRATGQPDITGFPRVLALMDEVRRARGPDFSGLVSALWLGDRLAAVHLGLRTPTVLHYWLPAYDPELAASSPGLLCLLEIARAAASLGVVRIDLGKGDEEYKRRLASGAVMVAEGAVDFRPLAGPMARGWFLLGTRLRRSPLRRPLLGPARWLRRLHAWALRNG